MEMFAGYDFALDVNWLRWVSATVAMGLMLLALYLITLKFGTPRVRDGLPKNLELLESLRISPKHTIVYVNIDGHKTAILLSPNGETQLDLYPEDLAPEA